MLLIPIFNLSSRLIYRHWEERAPLTNKELSVALGVSDRTIRNDIASVNESSEKEGHAIQSGNDGYYIRVEETEWFRKLVKKEEERLLQGLMTVSAEKKYLSERWARFLERGEEKAST